MSDHYFHEKKIMELIKHSYFDNCKPIDGEYCYVCTYVRSNECINFIAMNVL